MKTTSNSQSAAAGCDDQISRAIWANNRPSKELENDLNKNCLIDILWKFPVTINLIEKLGLHELSKTILCTSFIHKSFLNECKNIELDNNERLEFLGDSVLGLYFSERLLVEYPYLNEGELSRIRSALVCGETFAKLASLLDLSKLLILGKGELQNIGYKKESLLEDVFEAFVGGIYLDQGQKFTWKVLSKILNEYEINYGCSFIEIENLIQRDSKSLLQEKSMEQFRELPQYSWEILPDENFKVTVSLRGKKIASVIDSSKKRGEKMAAEMALKTNLHQLETGERLC